MASGKSAAQTNAINRANPSFDQNLWQASARPRLPEYLTLYWNSRIGSLRIGQAAATTAGLYTLSAQTVEGKPVTPPPHVEQRQIVLRVGALFALAETIEKKGREAAKSADKLTQATLPKALRRELGSAEPGRREGRDYEAAHELPERTKAKRNASEPHPAGRQSPSANLRRRTATERGHQKHADS